MLELDFLLTWYMSSDMIPARVGRHNLKTSRIYMNQYLQEVFVWRIERVLPARIPMIFMTI